MATAARPGIALGRILGVPVWLAPSWFIVAAIVIVLFEPNVAQASDVGRPATYLVAGAFVLLLLVSVLVHELAHAMSARALAMPVDKIVLTLWGGHTQFADEAPTPGRSATVAVAGPLANAFLAGVGMLLLTQLDGGGVIRLLAVALVATNAFVAVFNLAPGLPLDGGRVVEAGVWALTGRRWRGTVVAGWCGRIVAVLVVFWALGWPVLQGRSPGPFSLVWSLMIALMLWQGASSAVAVGRMHAGAEHLDLGRFIVPAVPSPVDTAQWQSIDPGRHIIAVDADGRPVGLLSAQARAELATGVRPPPPGTALAAVMTVLDPAVSIPARASGAQVLQALARTPAHTYVVVDGAGAVVGLAQGQQLADAVTARP